MKARLGIVAGRGSQTTRYWVARTHADLYFQAGTHDERVPQAQILALIHAAPGRPRVSWYATGHGMNRRSFDDQVAWQARELGLR